MYISQKDTSVQAGEKDYYFLNTVKCVHARSHLFLEKCILETVKSGFVVLCGG